jgi:dihydroneopterin aldolase
MIVELQQIKFFAYHGLYDFERTSGGDFLLDILIDTPDNESYKVIDDVADYEKVYAIIKEHMETPQLFIEEVARLIKLDLISAFATANYIKVSVTKCAPPIQGMSGSAKVTATYSK